ncbi:MAG: sugar ABC transporter permease [Firmicutes bacterium]|nr:sugar ABC transporter permease [Bacillota bacterium]
MFGIIIAFKRYIPKPGYNFIYNLFNSPWVGIKNFIFLFISRDSYIIFRNTLLYNIVFIVLGIVIPVTLAILISQLYSQRYAKIIQTATFLPHFLSWVVVSNFVVTFLNPDKGLLNRIIVNFGSNPVMWYMEPKYWPFILVFMNLWKGMGYSMIIYLASINSIDTTYYEAAIIDGATKKQQVFKITIPLLRPIITILFILSIGRIFNSDFGLFYQVPQNSGSLFNVTATIDVYVYTALMKLNNIGMSSAAAMFQSVFGFFSILIANLIVRKLEPDMALF